MITGTYTLVADPSWALSQLSNVYLTVDASAAPVTINLPELSTVTALNVKIHVIVAVGGNTTTINAYSEVGPPPVQDTISGGTSFGIYNEGDSCILTINQADGVATSWAVNAVTETPFIGGSIAAISQATFALAQYVALPIGWTGYVLDYDGSGFGCAVTKTSVANGDYQDWLVVATEDTASTGGFGQNPA